MSDWSLPAEVFRFLEHRIRGKCVVELGSGAGSPRLRKLCDFLYSVEHDREYFLKYPEEPGMIAIHAPIDPATGWYSRAVLEEWLPKPGDIDAVIVDGPPGRIGRGGLLQHLDLFPDVPFLFDDTHRAAERELAVSYYKVRGKQSISLHALKDGRGFSTVGWEW